MTVFRGIRACVIASLVVSLGACDESLAPTVPIDTEFVLAPGESSSVDDLTVRFLRVVADSRCPADATCVWQGDAHVVIAASRDGHAREYDFHTSDLKPASHQGYTIHLVQLQPYPFSSRTIRPEEYRVTLRVAR